MGFIKFLFQIAFALLGIVVFFIGFGILLENWEEFPRWLQFATLPVILLVMLGVFGGVFWKPLLVLFGIYKVKEELKK